MEGRLVATTEELGPRARAKLDQILSGARRVFLRDGFAAASTDAIAAEARVSKRTLYVYYPSKEELFADVMRKLTIENPQTRALETIADTHRFPQLGGIFRATVPERALRSFAIFIERGRERGVVGPGVDGGTAARMFVGPLLTYAVLDGLLAEGPPRPPAREKIEEIVDLYMKAIT